MDTPEVEENLFSASNAKLHGDMCKALSAIYCKVMSIFPSLEAARPRSKSGIQALCSLHIALEKAKNILQHCSECSKLYLAITGDSVVLKFERTQFALIASLRRVEDIVPQSIGSQILEVVNELEGIAFSLDPLEKQIGDKIIGLLQQGIKFDNCSDTSELESFHQAAVKLGICSSRAALTERRALKKLIERARVDEDKRKESIVAYLLHLMRKYSKLFRSEVSDDNDSQGSSPCSPTVHDSLEDGESGGICHAFDRQVSKLSSFNFKSSATRSGRIPVPPEELRCPISLQLMYDPVIIASGQTYERICIEKWFSDGHNTCPKTQQQLTHLSLTPNYCVKGLISSWSEQNGVSVPDGPPESLDVNYWRLALSESDSTISRSDSVSSFKLKGMKVAPLEESGTIEEGEGSESEDAYEEQECKFNVFERYQDYLKVLDEEEDMRKKCQVVEQIRLLLKDDDEARICLGANGFIEALLQFLDSAVRENNTMAQEVGSMALFNLAINNNRNKELMLASGVISVLEEMIFKSHSHKPTTALYLNLSYLEEAKPIIGCSQGVHFLVQVLQAETDSQCKLDALCALYNLSTLHSNIPNLLSAGVIISLQSLTNQGNPLWTEKSLAVLLNLASTQYGKDTMVSEPGLIGNLATILELGEPIEQELAVSCLLTMCLGNENCCLLVLQEGVIPSLVSISMNGTTRAREKAQQLLTLFKEQRQRDQTHESHPKVEATIKKTASRSPSPTPSPSPPSIAASESKPLCKSISRRKMGRAISSLWKSKSYSVYQC